MTGKARHKKRNHSFQSKKKKDRLSRSAVVAQQPAAETVEPISPTTSPSAGVPTPMAKPTAVQYPYISTELRTIGILAGIMLTILIVLASVLS